ncbi:MAG: hypothetical protein KGP28_07505 [Bdellovibrionales bacterium]|nr:hypothetical protein [Bdellovibrionales bacterium]
MVVPIVIVFVIIAIFIFSFRELNKGLAPLDLSLQRIIGGLKGIERNSGADPRVAETIRGIFKQEGAIYHHWQEFFESVASKQHGEDLVLSATRPATEYFSFDNLVHTIKWRASIKFEVFSTVPSVLTGLGLLGTFFGLYLGLPQDTQLRDEEIGLFLQHMRGAFLASIVGVSGALVFNIIEKAAREKVQSHCIELTNLIDQTFPRQTELEVLSDIRAHSDQQLAQLKSLAIDIGNEVARGIVGNATANIKIDEGLKEGIAKGFGILAEQLQQFVEIQRSFSASMIELQNVQREIGSTFQEIQASSRNSVEQIQRASEAIGKSAEGLSGVSERFPALIGQISSSVEANASTGKVFAYASEALVGATTNFVNQQNEFQVKFSGTISEFDRTNSSFIEQFNEYNAKQSVVLKQTFDGFDGAMAEAVEKLGSGVGNLNILMNDFLEKLDRVQENRQR